MPLEQILLGLNNKKIIVLACLALASLCYGFTILQKELGLGQQAPKIESTLYNKKDFKLSSLKGSITLVYFWATWDLPSLNHNFFLNEIHNKYKDTRFANAKKFNIVAVSIDQKPESFKVFMARENYSWNYFICDYKGWNSPIIDSFKVTNIPASFLLDQNGKIIGKNIFDKDLDNKLFELIKP